MGRSHFMTNFWKACMMKFNNAKRTLLLYEDYKKLMKYNNQVNKKLNKELEKQSISINIYNFNTIPTLGWIVGFVEVAAKGSFGI